MSVDSNEVSLIEDARDISLPWRRAGACPQLAISVSYNLENQPDDRLRSRARCPLIVWTARSLHAKNNKLLRIDGERGE